MADSNNITFFLAFKNESPSWKLISCASMMGIIAILGIVLNFAVILVTIRTKKLNGTVNYLLALCSFLEILHQFGHFLFVYTAFSGQNLIEYHLAAKIIFIPLLGLCGITPAMFFTGVDRLIVLIFGEIQTKCKVRLHLTTITLITAVYSCFLCISTLFDPQIPGDLMITGCIVDFFMFPTLFSGIILLFVLIMTCIIYLLVGIVIKIQSIGLPSADSINHRVFRALCCIVTVNIGGYLICQSFVSLIRSSIPSPITAWFVQVITSMLLNISAASNGIILYFTSTEYRQAFRDEFPTIFKQNLNLNVIQVSPQQNGSTFALTAGYHRNTR